MIENNSCRGFYSCAFATRFGGHLVQGGKDQLVKGINKEGEERYFTLSFVESATDYWKRILLKNLEKQGRVRIFTG